MLNMKEKISFRERQILLHSFIYYHADSNVISDKQYDSLSYGLEKMIKEHPQEFKESEYYHIFYDWTPATGFDLIDRLSEQELYRVTNIANVLLKPHL